MEQKKYLKPRETLSFATAGFGRSMMYTLMSTFALIFYTDMGIDAVHASAIILAARIFDALNDPVMGIIVDKTKTKYGKMRPYLKWRRFRLRFRQRFCFIAPLPIIIR